MPEVIGDIVIPSALVIPKKEGTYIGKEGEIILSGNKLWMNDGTNMVIITSS